MPVDTPWPQRRGRCLPYLLSIDLAAIPTPKDWPSAGMLLVFGSYSGAATVWVPSESTCVSRPSPKGPYLDDDVPEETPPRQRLMGINGIARSSAFPEDDEDADERWDAILERIRPEGAVARLGGGHASSDDGETDRELAYLRSHDREGLWLIPKEDPATVLQAMEACRQRSSQDHPAPAPVPQEVAARLHAEIPGFLSVAKGTTDPDVAFATKELKKHWNSVRREGAASPWMTWHSLLMAWMQWQEALVQAATHEPQFVASMADFTAIRSAVHRKQQRFQRANRFFESFMAKLVRDPAGTLRNAAHRQDAAVNSRTLDQDPALATAQITEAVDGMVESDMRRDYEQARQRWNTLETMLASSAARIDPDALFMALQQRWRVGNNLQALRFRQEGPSLEQLIKRHDDLVWWASRTDHAQEMAGWRPLLNIYSVDHFCWGDMGVLVLWIDQRDLESGDFSRLQGVVSTA